MKRLGLLFLILMVVGGCSEKKNIHQLTMNYEKQIDEKQKMIQVQENAIKKLNEEIETYKFVPDPLYFVHTGNSS